MMMIRNIEVVVFHPALVIGENFPSLRGIIVEQQRQVVTEVAPA